MKRESNEFAGDTETSNQPPIPGWEQMRRDSHRFPQGSIGHEMFPEELGGRWRPFSAWSVQDISVFLETTGETSVGAIVRASMKVDTIGDLLKRSVLPHSTAIRQGIERSFASLKISPHQKLHAAVIEDQEYEQIVVSPLEEEALIRHINAAVDRLPEEQRAVVDALYGLSTAVPQQADAYAKSSGRTVSDIHSLQVAALASLGNISTGEQVPSDERQADAGIKPRRKVKTRHTVLFPAQEEVGVSDEETRMFGDLQLTPEQEMMPLTFLGSDAPVLRVLRMHGLVTVGDLQAISPRVFLEQKGRIQPKILVRMLDDVQRALGVSDRDFAREAAEALYIQRVVRNPIRVDDIRMQRQAKESGKRVAEQQLLDGMIKQARVAGNTTAEEIQIWLWAHQHLLPDGTVFGLDPAHWTVPVILRHRMEQEQGVDGTNE